jgi:SWI/SNF-related matrix-associated actin-dependent regulator 1 of chromatin subfamily A
MDGKISRKDLADSAMRLRMSFSRQHGPGEDGDEAGSMTVHTARWVGRWEGVPVLALHLLGVPACLFQACPPMTVVHSAARCAGCRLASMLGRVRSAFSRNDSAHTSSASGSNTATGSGSSPEPADASEAAAAAAAAAAATATARAQLLAAMGSDFAALQMGLDTAAAPDAAAAAGGVQPVTTFQSVSRWLEEHSSDLQHGARHPDVASLLLGGRRGKARGAQPHLLPLSQAPAGPALRSAVSGPAATGRAGSAAKRQQRLARGSSWNPASLQQVDEEQPGSPWAGSSTDEDDVNSPGSFARRWLRSKRQRSAPAAVMAAAAAAASSAVAASRVHSASAAAPSARTGDLAASAALVAANADAMAQAAQHSRHKGYYSLWQTAAAGGADAAAPAAPAPAVAAPAPAAADTPPAGERTGSQTRHQSYYSIWQSAAAALDAPAGEAAASPAGPVDAHGPAAAPPASARHRKYYSMWQAAAQQLSDDEQADAASPAPAAAVASTGSVRLAQQSANEGDVVVVDGTSRRGGSGGASSSGASDVPPAHGLDVWQPRSLGGWSIKVGPSPLVRAVSAPCPGASSGSSCADSSSGLTDFDHCLGSGAGSSSGSAACAASSSGSSGGGGSPAAPGPQRQRMVRFADEAAISPRGGAPLSKTASVGMQGKWGSAAALPAMAGASAQRLAPHGSTPQ